MYSLGTYLDNDVGNVCFFFLCVCVQAHERARSARNEVAHIRCEIVRLEEESKLLAKDKALLEVAIQNKRKELSINQQSQATRQKMSTKEKKVI